MNISRTDNNHNTILAPEDSNLGNDDEMTVSHQEEVVTFTNPDVPDGAGKSASMGYLVNQSDEIANFLRRPIKIGNLSTTAPNLAFSPLYAYLGNAQIYDKMNHYRFLRATLKLRFIMTASPFIMGRTMIYYTPSPTGQFTRTHPTVISNLPHIIMDPSVCSDCVMTIPFHYPVPYLDLSAPITSPGLLDTELFYPFKNVSTGTAALVTISVTAWLEDVELKVSAITPNSNNSHGSMLSTGATAIADVADQLSALPLIGKFATATSIGARAVGGIASLFGFSKPILLDNPNRAKIVSVGEFANTNGMDVAYKLTLDPKCERTIDNSMINGEEHDEMTIKGIVSRFSYMDGSSWDQSTLVGANIEEFHVNPAVYNGVVNSELHMSNLCFGTLPFSQWRGSIMYKFSLIKTKYHRGKLRVSWTPDNTTAATDLNIHLGYSIIWDIEEMTECTINVPYNVTRPYLEVAPNLWGSGASGANGYIQITVIESLTGPADLTDVVLQTWIAGGDDYTVNRLDHGRITNLVTKKPLSVVRVPPLTWAPQWNRLGAEGSAVSLHAAHAIPNSLSSNVNKLDVLIRSFCHVTPNSAFDIAPRTSFPTADLVTVGESVVSFRDLLHRYCYEKTVTLGPLETYFHPVFPVIPGNTVRSGVDYTPTDRQTLLSYLMPSYYAYRGSARYKVLPHNSNVVTDMVLVATRDISPRDARYTAADVYDQAQMVAGGSLQGSASSFTSVSGALEFEVPFYQTTLFSDIAEVASDEGSMKFNGFWVGMLGVSLATNILSIFRSSGDDIDLAYYVGPPTMYSYLIRPGP